MEKKLIALAFSDHHLANWKQFNEDGKRLHNAGYAPLEKIFSDAYHSDVPILFTGDLVDHPKRVDNVVLKTMASAFGHDLMVPFVGINGNHDIYRQSTYKDTSWGYLNSLSTLNEKVHCVDKSHHMLGYDLGIDSEFWVNVHGIPYFHGDNGFLEALEERVKVVKKGGADYNILLIHRDLAGAVEPTGEVLPKDKEQDKPMKKLFKNFDLVLSGHIHKAQQIKNLGDNVWMLGSTNQQRRSDMGTQCGYWAIWATNKGLVPEFVPLDTPQFLTYTDDNETTDDYNYWIKLPKDEVKESLDESDDSFSVESDRKDMVDAYFKVKGIKDKAKKKMALKYLNV